MHRALHRAVHHTRWSYGKIKFLDEERERETEGRGRGKRDKGDKAEGREGVSRRKSLRETLRGRRQRAKEEEEEERRRRRGLADREGDNCRRASLSYVALAKKS